MAEFAALTHPGNREGANQDSIGWDSERQLYFEVLHIHPVKLNLSFARTARVNQEHM